MFIVTDFCYFDPTFWHCQTFVITRMLRQKMSTQEMPQYGKATLNLLRGIQQLTIHARRTKRAHEKRMK
jgi:hypothetical protein